MASFSTQNDMDAIKQYIETQIELYKKKEEIECDISSMMANVGHLWAILDEDAEIVDTDFLDRIIQAVVKTQKMMEMHDSNSDLDENNDDEISWDSIVKSANCKKC